LGKVINIVEGTSGATSYRSIGFEGGGGGGAPVEPGSQNISKSVTVTFELR